MNKEICPICSNSSNIDYSAYNELSLDSAPKKFQVLKCSYCGFRWLTPPAEPEDFNNFYSAGYYANQTHGGQPLDERTESLSVCYQETIDKFLKLGLKGKLLDVGCGRGEFLSIALKSYNQIEGIEPSPYGAEIANDLGITIHNGLLSELHERKLTYDGIHCCHVLEHVPNVNAFMQDIKNVLNPGGIVYIEVPIQFDGILDIADRIRNKKHEYSDYSIHHHYFFTPKSIKLLMEKFNFELLSLSTFMPCRRIKREPSLRKLALQSTLFAADLICNKGDLISIWARQK